MAETPSSSGVLGVPGAHGQLCPDAERLVRLVREHHGSVWRFLRRLGVSETDADDALQEVILITARRLPALEQKAERSFLFGTALRVAHGMWRRRSRRGERDAEILDDLPSSDPCPELLAEKKRMRDLLDELLGQMPYELRAVLVLYEIEEFTMAAIAELLGIPPGTAASRLRRAREDFEARVKRVEARRRGRGLP